MPAMIRFMSGSTNLPALSAGNAFTVTANKLAVRVQLSATDLQNIHDNPNIGLPAQANMTSLQLNSGAFSDYASNPILGTTNLNAQMVVADTTPPTLSSFMLNLITGQFFLTFSEPVTISDQQLFISSISITNSPTSPTVSLTAANSQNQIIFAMPTSNTVTLTLPPDLHQLIDDSTVIATSANNVHLSLCWQPNVRIIMDILKVGGDSCWTRTASLLAVTVKAFPALRAGRLVDPDMNRIIAGM